MARSTAETIKQITREHLDERNGLLFGQCVSAVGWIGGTVPDCKNIIEIPMTDVAASGFAVGAALMGRRPIFVMRYQGFIWYNCSSLINYAARSKQVWGNPCPVFIRSLAMEGSGIGHTASSSLHSVFMHVPGMMVAAPMTPNEYQNVWDTFMKNDDPIYCSEHRRSFALTDEMPNQIHSNAKITVLAISSGRLNALPAVEALRAKGINADLFHQVWLKPFVPADELIASLQKTKIGLVIDSDFEHVGASEALAHRLMLQTGAHVHALGLEDRVCGVADRVENITPSPEKILQKINSILR